MKNTIGRYPLIAAMIAFVHLVPLTLFAAGERETAETPERKISVMMGSNRYRDAYRTMFDKIGTDHVIEMDLQIIPDEQFDNLIKTKLATREVPDIFLHNAPEYYDAVRVEENCVDLTDQPWVSRLTNPGMVIDSSGRIWAMPETSGSFFGAAYYNKDVLNRLGITDPRPKTYAEFIAILERIKAADSDVVPLFMSDRDNWTTQIFMAVGYSYALEDRTEEVYRAIMNNELKFQDVPEFEGILNDYLTLIERELVNPDHLSATYDDATAAVASGRAAMIYNGEWVISSLEAEGASVGAFPIPWTDKDLLITGRYTTGYFVPSAGDNVELALEVLNAIAQPEYLGIFFAENPAFTGIAGVDGGDLNTDVKAMVDSYLAAGKTRYTMNDYMPELSTLWTELWAYYVDMAAGVITPRETLVRWDERIADHMAAIGKPGW